MTTYEYGNKAGDEYVILAAMKDAPPDTIIVEDGEWVEAFFTPDGEHRGDPPQSREHDGPNLYRRLYRTAPPVAVKKSAGVHHPGQTIPISQSLPTDTRPGQVVTAFGHKVKQHADGSLATLSGDRIIGTQRDVDLHTEDCGFHRED